MHQRAVSQVVAYQRNRKPCGADAHSDCVANHDQRRQSKDGIDRHARLSSWRRHLPDCNSIACLAQNSRNCGLAHWSRQDRARHDDQPIVQKDASDKIFVWVRIDPYHEVISLFHHIDAAIFRRDL
jgi:hypothetical protein